MDTLSNGKSISGGSYHAYAKGGCTDHLHKPTPSEVENGNRVMMTTAITVHHEKRSPGCDEMGQPKDSSEGSTSTSSSSTAGSYGGGEKS